MKKFAIVVSSLLVSCALCFAGNNPKVEESSGSQAGSYFYTLTDYAINGSYSLTNNKSQNWSLDNVSFIMPETITNAFTITWTRPIKTVTLIGAQVTTNWFGTVETNQNNAIASVSTWVLTGTYFSVTATNSVFQSYDEFGKA